MDGIPLHLVHEEAGIYWEVNLRSPAQEETTHRALPVAEFDRLVGKDAEATLWKTRLVETSARLRAMLADVRAELRLVEAAERDEAVERAERERDEANGLIEAARNLYNFAEAERDEARAAVERLTGDLARADREFCELKETTHGLRTFIRNRVRHDSACHWYRRDNAPCTCGLADALKEAHHDA